ncbi:hypothetical protein WDU94_013881 [Cyamophila willieti]
MSSESLNPEQVLQMLEEDDDDDDDISDDDNVEIQSEDDDSDEDPDYVPENLKVVEEQMTECIRDIESAHSTPSQISKRRKTNKTINAFVIYSHNTLRAKQTPMNRQDFMMKLHEQLAIKWQKMRLEKSKSLNITTKLSLQKVTGDSLSATCGSAIKTGRRKYCNFCNYKKKRMTAVTCDKCEKFICDEHQIKFCRDCITEN